MALGTPNTRFLSISVYREGSPGSMVDVVISVNQNHSQASWEPFIQQVKLKLEIDSLEGIYTEYEGLPVFRIATLIEGAIYVARPTENCALVRSILVDQENKEQIPAYKHIEESRIARIKLKEYLDEYESELPTEGGLLDLNEEQKWVESWNNENKAEEKVEAEAAPSGPVVSAFRRNSLSKHEVLKLIRTMVEIKVSKKGASNFNLEESRLEVVQSTLRSVSNFLAKDENARLALANTSQCIQIILSSMEHFREDRKVAVFGSWVLANIGYGDPDHARTMGQAGGVKVLRRIATVHMSDSQALVHIMGALFALMNTDMNNRKLAADNQFLGTSFECMAKYPDNQELMTYCCWVVLVILENSEQAQITPEQAQTVQLVLTRNHNHEEIHISAQEILKKITIGEVGCENEPNTSNEYVKALNVGQAQGSL